MLWSHKWYYLKEKVAPIIIILTYALSQTINNVVIKTVFNF